MSKTFNRQQARAYVAEADEKRRAESRAAKIAADLEELGRLRDYLIKQCHGPEADTLRSAIDDYAGHLTGDRTALHTPHHSLNQGPKNI